MGKERYIQNYFGIKYRSTYNISVKCPFHDDEIASAGINFQKKLYNCFKCGGMTFDQLYKRLIQFHPQGERVNSHENEKRKKIPKLNINLQEYGEQYLEKRGLTIDKIPIEWEIVDQYTNDEGKFERMYGYIIFESVDGYITGRNLLEELVDIKRPKYSNEPNPKHLFWIDKQKDNKVIFLVEGIFDALSLYELGIRNICCSAGSNISKDHANEIAHSFRDYTVLIIYDRDPAGYKGAIEVSNKFKEYQVDHVILELPKQLESNDLNEALVKNKDKLYIWLSAILDKYFPDDTAYVNKLFRGKHMDPLNILPTGIIELDKKLTGGFKDGGHIIAGNTGIGKTSLIFNLSVNAVTKYGKRVMVNSCEISKRQSWARIATQFSEFTWEELEEEPKKLEDDSYKLVEEISKDIIVVNGWPLKRIVQEADQFDVIMIDYIQRVREAYGSDESATRFLINNYVSTLTDLGALQGKICIMISSLGRAYYDKPDQFGLKESGSLDFMATTISRLSPSNKDNENFYWNLQKNNRGHKGNIKISGVDLGHCDFTDGKSEEII